MAIGLSGDAALAIAKAYTKQTAEGMGAVKGKDGFSPTITESPDNTDEVYQLDITNQAGSYRTPNLKGGGGGGSNDYNQAVNKPQINNQTLVGNKTFQDLGLKPLTNTEIMEIINKANEQTKL